MTDLFGFDLQDGLESGHCALCFAMARHTRRWLDSVWKEGRRDPETRKRFYASGGFCPRHAWLLRELVGESDAAIADLYGHLADKDLARLHDELGRRRQRRRCADVLRREADCSACTEETEALPRKCVFLLELLATDSGREKYERSAGVCLLHLVDLLDAAEHVEGDSRYLLQDAQRRLSELRGRVADYDRTRDYRWAHERRQSDRQVCTEIIEQYVGAQPIVSPPTHLRRGR